MRILSVDLVTATNLRQDANLRMGLFMSELASKVSGKIINYQLPENAPPDVPRIAVVAKNTSFFLGLDRLQISIKVAKEISQAPDMIFDTACLQSLSYFENYIKEVGSPYSFTGVIVTSHFPRAGNPSQLKIAEQMHDALLNLDRGGNPVASFVLQTGYQIQDHFVNYTLSGYEMRTLKIPNGLPPGSYQINVNNAAVSESGIEIKVDVNNKVKKVKLSPIEELKEVLKLSLSETTKLKDKFLLADNVATATKVNQ
jgi:hypothetical protein